MGLVVGCCEVTRCERKASTFSLELTLGTYTSTTVPHWKYESVMEIQLKLKAETPVGGAMAPIKIGNALQWSTTMLGRSGLLRAIVSTSRGFDMALVALWRFIPTSRGPVYWSSWQQQKLPTGDSSSGRRDLVLDPFSWTAKL